MSVVSGKVIFCEGKTTSLDFRLLNRVIENLSSKPTIVPAGGKFTFSIFAQGYFSNTVKTQSYIVFRDRDFDVKPTANITLLPLYAMLLTHRACIENYLLDANLINDYWKARYAEKLANPTSRWDHRDSPGIREISAWIEEAAKSLQAYQSVRWALADLLDIPGVRSQLKTTWTGGSGNLPSSLDLEYCQNESVRLIHEFRNPVEQVTQERFETSLATYQQQFDQEEFWTQKHYLIWFHGKDIQKAMQRQRSQYIPLKKDFFDWVLDQPDIHQYLLRLHPDLMQLQNEIERLGVTPTDP